MLGAHRCGIGPVHLHTLSSLPAHYPLHAGDSSHPAMTTGNNHDIARHRQTDVYLVEDPALIPRMANVLATFTLSILDFVSHKGALLSFSLDRTCLFHRRLKS